MTSTDECRFRSSVVGTIDASPPAPFDHAQNSLSLSTGRTTTITLGTTILLASSVTLLFVPYI
jgi:hypothetical protein